MEIKIPDFLLDKKIIPLLIILTIIVFGIITLFSIGGPNTDDNTFTEQTEVVSDIDPEYNKILNKIKFELNIGDKISDEELSNMQFFGNNSGIWVDLRYRDIDMKKYNIKGGTEYENTGKIDIGWEYRITIENDRITKIEKVR